MTPSARGGRCNGRLSKIHPASVDDVIYGCVSQIDPQTLNVARTSILASKLPESVPGVSIDRQYGSSQQSVHFAAQAIMSGTQDVIIAGGVEVMSQVPILSAKDVAEKAGMDNPFDSVQIRKRYPGCEFSQFDGAEKMAKNGVTRAELDYFAWQSPMKGKAAYEAGRFKDELVTFDVELEGVKKTVRHEMDEGLRFNATLEATRWAPPAPS